MNIKNAFVFLCLMFASGCGAGVYGSYRGNLGADQRYTVYPTRSRAYYPPQYYQPAYPAYSGPPTVYGGSMYGRTGFDPNMAGVQGRFDAMRDAAKRGTIPMVTQIPAPPPVGGPPPVNGTTTAPAENDKIGEIARAMNDQLGKTEELQNEIKELKKRLEELAKKPGKKNDKKEESP